MPKATPFPRTPPALNNLAVIGHNSGLTLKRTRKRGPIVERRAYRIAEFLAMSGLSRAAVYRHIKSGEIKTFKVGGVQVIPAAEVDRLIGAA